MKKGLVTAVAIIFAAIIFNGTARAQFGSYYGTAESPTIRVSGDAEVWVAPEQITVYSGIEFWGHDLDSCMTVANERAENILKLRKKYDIAPRHVQTDYINIEPTTKSINGHNVDGYTIRKSITFILSDLSRFDSFMKEVIDAGANTIHDVKFQTLELKKYREQVRALAIRAAREKAQRLATELGQDIGPAVSINEGNSYYGYWGYDSWNRRNGYGGSQVSFQADQYNAPAPEGSVALGQIRVYASVNVVFSLQ